MSDTPTERPNPRTLAEYLTPVEIVPRREEPALGATSDSEGLGPYVGMEEYQQALEAAERAVEPRFLPTYGDQMALSLDSLATVPTAEDTARLVFVGQALMLVSHQLDRLLPPGRHKNLCMTALEEAGSRARMALLTDLGIPK